MNNPAYVAGNFIQFYHLFVDETNAPIDISSATSVTLHLQLPDGSTRTVTGSYSATSDKNKGIATTAIANSEIPGTLGANVVAKVYWQLVAVLASQSEPVASPQQTLEVEKTL